MHRLVAIFAAWMLIPLIAAMNHAVKIQNYSYQPKILMIKEGDSVTWTNYDGVIHTTTANRGTWDSGRLEKGKSYTYTFTKKGGYSYYCRPHPYMKGKVIVK